MAVVSMSRDLRLWDSARVARFTRDWNDQLAIDALREKYGIVNLRRFVQNLREHGHHLVTRRGAKA